MVTQTWVRMSGAISVIGPVKGFRLVREQAKIGVFFLSEKTYFLVHPSFTITHIWTGFFYPQILVQILFGKLSFFCSVKASDFIIICFEIKIVTVS